MRNIEKLLKWYSHFDIIGTPETGVLEVRTSHYNWNSRYDGQYKSITLFRIPYNGEKWGKMEVPVDVHKQEYAGTQKSIAYDLKLWQSQQLDFWLQKYQIKEYKEKEL